MMVDLCYVTQNVTPKWILFNLVSMAPVWIMDAAKLVK